MSNILISIIVPCYNQAQYLDECLQSVLDQRYQDWECVIINDGSPDNTEEVAKKWVEKDSRFTYLYKDNGGLSSARNAGIEIASGEWILPLDCDDKISSDYLELAKNEFSKDYTIIYCKAEKFGFQNEIWPLPDFNIKSLAIENIIFCTAFFKKSNWKKVSGYDENLKYGWEDWEFWISLLENGGSVYQLDKICFFYRTKEVSMITELTKEKNNKLGFTYEQIYAKHINFFITHLGTFFDLIVENNTLRNENQNLKKKYFSKRYKYAEKIFNLLKI